MGIGRYPILYELMKIISHPLVFFLLWLALSNFVSHTDIWSSIDCFCVGDCHNLLLHRLFYILHLHHMVLPSLNVFVRSHLINSLILHTRLTSWKRWVCGLSWLLVHTIKCWLDLEIHHFCYIFLISILNFGLYSLFNYYFWFIVAFYANFDSSDIIFFT